MLSPCAGENVNIQLGWILDAAPSDFGRKRDDRPRFGIDGNILEPNSDIAPLSARNLLASKEVGLRSRWQPDSLNGESSFGVGGSGDRGSDQL